MHRRYITIALVALAAVLTVATGAVAWTGLSHVDEVRETCEDEIAYRYEPEGTKWTHTGFSGDTATGYFEGNLWGDDPALVHFECTVTDGQLRELHTWQ